MEEIPNHVMMKTNAVIGQLRIILISGISLPLLLINITEALTMKMR